MHKMFSLCLSIQLFTISIQGQSESQVAFNLYHDGQADLFSEKYTEAAIHFQEAAEAATTDRYRLHSQIFYAECLFYLGDPSGAKALLDAVLADPWITADMNGPYTRMVAAEVYATILTNQAGIDAAIAYRSQTIDELLPLDLVPDILVDLYRENARAEVGRGDHAAAAVWYDRIFADLPDYGYQDDASGYDRHEALRSCGSPPKTDAYIERLLELLSIPGFEDDRGRAWLYARLVYDHTIPSSGFGDESRAHLRSVALNLYADSMEHGWHLPHDEQNRFDSLSEFATDWTHDAIISVLLPCVLQDAKNEVETLENVLYAKLLYKYFRNHDHVVAFQGKLRTISTNYDTYEKIFHGGGGSIFWLK